MAVLTANARACEQSYFQSHQPDKISLGGGGANLIRCEMCVWRCEQIKSTSRKCEGGRREFNLDAMNRFRNNRFHVAQITFADGVRFSSDLQLKCFAFYPFAAPDPACEPKQPSGTILISRPKLLSSQINSTNGFWNALTGIDQRHFATAPFALPIKSLIRTHYRHYCETRFESIQLAA